MASQPIESPASKFSAFPIHHAAVRYTSHSCRLQTLDIWLPRPLEESDPKETTWVIYIHGGAWRDPLQDSHCILPTLSHLSKSGSQISNIAGIASLNYRLSPYPSHPTHPSDSDPDRNITHPTHIHDVSAAMSFLRTKYGVGNKYRWIGVGHSCGATLLMQYLGRIGLPPLKEIEEGADETSRPCSFILVSGIYSLPHFLSAHQAPHCPENIAKIYNEIVVGAFGPDEKDWDAASPEKGQYPVQGSNPMRIALAHSPDDELVEQEQVALMLATLRMNGWRVKEESTGESMRGDVRNPHERGICLVETHALNGTHDEVWEDGAQVAELIHNALKWANKA